MTTEYAIPSPTSRAPVAPDEVVLVASGDLRHSANRTGWPAQQKLEADLAAALARARHPRTARARLRRGGRPRLHLEPAHGHGRLRGHPPGRAGHRGRSGLGVHPPRARRPQDAARPDPHGRQLERPVAGPRGPAQPQRLHDEGGHGLQHHLERGLHRRVRAARPQGVGDQQAHHPRHLARASRWTQARCPRGRPSWAAPWLHSCSATKAVMGVFDEGCMGMYNAIFDDEYLNPMGIYKERLSQSALYYRMTHGPRRRGRGRSSTGWSSGA